MSTCGSLVCHTRRRCRDQISQFNMEPKTNGNYEIAASPTLSTFNLTNIPSHLCPSFTNNTEVIEAHWYKWWLLISGHNGTSGAVLLWLSWSMRQLCSGANCSLQEGSVRKVPVKWAGWASGEVWLRRVKWWFSLDAVIWSFLAWNAFVRVMLNSMPFCLLIKINVNNWFSCQRSSSLENLYANPTGFTYIQGGAHEPLLSQRHYCHWGRGW